MNAKQWTPNNICEFFPLMKLEDGPLEGSSNSSKKDGTTKALSKRTCSRNKKKKKGKEAPLERTLRKVNKKSRTKKKKKGEKKVLSNSKQLNPNNICELFLGMTLKDAGLSEGSSKKDGTKAPLLKRTCSQKKKKEAPSERKVNNKSRNKKKKKKKKKKKGEKKILMNAKHWNTNNICELFPAMTLKDAGLSEGSSKKDGTTKALSERTSSRKKKTKEAPLELTLRTVNNKSRKKKKEKEVGERGKYLFGVKGRVSGLFAAEIFIKDPAGRRRQLVWLGNFNTPKRAAYAHDQAAYKVYGSKARLNFPHLIARHQHTDTEEPVMPPPPPPPSSMN